jgi:hypothetical protein
LIEHGGELFEVAAAPLSQTAWFLERPSFVAKDRVDNLLTRATPDTTAAGIKLVERRNRFSVRNAEIERQPPPQHNFEGTWSRPQRLRAASWYDHHHCRVVRRIAAFLRIRRQDSFQIEFLAHSLAHKMRHVPGWNQLMHGRRQQPPLFNVPRTKGLAHGVQ